MRLIAALRTACVLVDRETLERDSKGLATPLRFAGLRQQATPEDVDHRVALGLLRSLLASTKAGRPLGPMRKLSTITLG
jgi:hypothetical protein